MPTPEAARVTVATARTVARRAIFVRPRATELSLVPVGYEIAMTEHSLTTPDGRSLQVAEGGDPRGFPVIYHHGTPSSRLLRDSWTEDAAGGGIRLIGFDRPGYGGSSPQRDRTVADVAGDVTTIADALGFEKYASWGISGGGPHVLACAALSGGRCVAAVSFASVAPWGADGLEWYAGMGEDNVVEFGAALQGRSELEPLLEEWRKEMLAADAGWVFETMKSLLSPVDLAVATGELAEILKRSSDEGLRNSIEGWVDDDLAFTRDWGFDIRDIDIPVLLFHGIEDRFVPTTHGEWLAARIPGVDARISKEDGHLTLLTTRIAESHAWLMEHV